MVRKVVRNDASLTGWGAVCDGHSANGIWPERDPRHINVLELDAIRLALRSFQDLLLGSHVLVRSDNTSAIAYINRQGGVRSKQLNPLATEIHLCA